MADAGAPLEEEDVEAMFKAKKKTKKKPAAAAAGEDALAAAAGGGGGGGGAGEPAAGAGASASAAGAGAAAGGAAAGGGQDENVDESYEDMLARVYSKLLENNPELLGREKKRLKPPQVSRVGTTRTAWTNFKDICAGLKRTPDHILSFYLAELGTTGAIDGSDRLLLKGKYMPKYIESLLRKYIAEFVQCHMCRNVETDLRRDNVSRLFFMDCKACGSSRSVAPIKAGFHATSKGERRKARDAASN